MKKYLTGLLMLGLVFMSGASPAHASMLTDMQAQVSTILTQVSLLPSNTISELQLKVSLLTGALGLQQQVNALILQASKSSSSVFHDSNTFQSNINTTAAASISIQSSDMSAPLQKGNTYTIHFSTSNLPLNHNLVVQGDIIPVGSDTGIPGQDIGLGFLHTVPVSNGGLTWALPNVSVLPAGNYMFWLLLVDKSASTFDGQIIARASVNITVVSPSVASTSQTPPPTMTFDGVSPSMTSVAQSLYITSGQSVTLYWWALNATSCTASGDPAWTGPKPLSANAVVVSGITVTKNLTLTCSGDTSPAATQSILVTVTPAVSATTLPPPPNYNFSVLSSDIPDGGILEIERGTTVQKHIKITFADITAFNHQSQIVTHSDSVSSDKSQPTFSWDRNQYAVTFGGDTGVLTISAAGAATGDYKVTHTFTGQQSGVKTLQYTLRVKSSTTSTTAELQNQINTLTLQDQINALTNAPVLSTYDYKDLTMFTSTFTPPTGKFVRNYQMFSEAKKDTSPTNYQTCPGLQNWVLETDCATTAWAQSGLLLSIRKTDPLPPSTRYITVRAVYEFSAGFSPWSNWITVQGNQ